MASDLASEVKLIFRVKGSKGWLCTLMASRGLTESIIKSLLKKLGCSLPPIFSIILGNILFFFFDKGISTAIACFCFCSVLFVFFFWRNGFTSGVRFYTARVWKLSNSPLWLNIWITQVIFKETLSMFKLPGLTWPRIPIRTSLIVLQYS